MKIYPRCAPCLLARVHYEAELSTDDIELQHKVVREAARWLGEACSIDAPATYVSTGVHRRAYEILGDEDPYISKKKISNEIAMKMLPAVEQLIKSNPNDAFRCSIVASIIGNSLDFGVLDFDVDIERFGDDFMEVFKRGLEHDDTDRMKELLDDVVYFADNCGEIVFDGLVLDQIRHLGGRVTLVVKGAPILSDVTLRDAQETGVDKRADRIMTTGSNAVGVDLDEAPAELIEAMNNASLTISKGMANYEALSEYDLKPIAYLLKAKCEPIAHSLGIEKGWHVAILYR